MRFDQIIVMPEQEAIRYSEQRHHFNGRYQCGKEARKHRRLSYKRQQYHIYARRYQKPQHSAACKERGAVPAGVIKLVHSRQEYGTNAGNRRVSAARNAAKGSAGQRLDDSKPALYLSDKKADKIDKGTSDTSGFHQLTREYEHGDRQ
jgi:hypothetical protein